MKSDNPLFKEVLDLLRQNRCSGSGVLKEQLMEKLTDLSTLSDLIEHELSGFKQMPLESRTDKKKSEPKLGSKCV